MHRIEARGFKPILQESDAALVVISAMEQCTRKRRMRCEDVLLVLHKLFEAGSGAYITVLRHIQQCVLLAVDMRNLHKAFDIVKGVMKFAPQHESSLQHA